MNILVVSSKYEPEYSGSGYRAHNTYLRLQSKYGIKFSVVTNSINYQYDEEYTIDDINVYRIGRKFNFTSKSLYLRKIQSVLNMVRECLLSFIYIFKNINNYDLLHTFGKSWSVISLTTFFMLKNKPIIRELCNDVDDPFYLHKYFHYIFRLYLSKKNVIFVAISRRLEITCNNFGIFNVWMRPNPINEKLFYEDLKNKYLYRSKLTKFSKKDIVLCMVANYIDRKNQLFAISILSELPTNFKLLLAGPLKPEGYEYYAKIKSKIHDLKLSERVNIKNGFVENFDEYIKCCDVFLFPSKEEGLGTPILESQACAIPVVANNIPGISDMIIENGVGGYYSDLCVDDWIACINKSLLIADDVLKKNSCYIKSFCSTQIIDTYYKQKISSLIKGSI